MANGLFGGGNGTEFTPYLVEDAQDLNAVRNYLGNYNVYFLQTQDIDMSSFGNFLPIQNGVSTSSLDVFKGLYNGQGFKIINLLCEHNRDYVGLFGYASPRIINVRLENAKISGINFVGGLVGYGNMVISQCYVTGTITGYNKVGGITGYAIASQISNCYTNCIITGVEEVGGIAGYLSDGSNNCSNCYTSGMITGSNRVGGIAGYAYGGLSGCFVLVEAICRKAGSSSSYIHDIAGDKHYNINNCYSIDTLEFRQLI